MHIITHTHFASSLLAFIMKELERDHAKGKQFERSGGLFGREAQEAVIVLNHLTLNLYAPHHWVGRFYVF